MKTLQQYATQHGIKYRAAWNRFHAGKIANAFQNELGKILIDDSAPDREPYVVIYARVSSSQNKDKLERQAERLIDFCAAKGYVVHDVVKECASGLNDERRKLMRVLNDERVTRIVVEHEDRLTRFGFNYLEEWMKERQCVIEVVNHAANDQQDLMQDFVSLVTCFTARLYGQRRSKRKTEQLIKDLENGHSH